MHLFALKYTRVLNEEKFKKMEEERSDALEVATKTNEEREEKKS